MKSRILNTLFASAFIFSMSGLGNMALANHSWGNYHWARTSNPFNVKLGDNLTSAWDPYLATASTDWSQSVVLDTTVVTGQSNPKNCRATAGRVEVCNSKYGNNGWLGIASVWANGDHITQGTVKLNDTYFNTTKYNTPAWKQLVLCQEVGHAFGLDHQDEVFTNTNLNTCMDYTNSPDSNQHPNQHDYEMLETIYSHLDTVTTVAATKSTGNLQDNFESPADWGKAIRTSTGSNPSLYMRDLGNSNKVFTFVIWAE